MLGLVVADRVYRQFPDLAEGQLSKIRASVVNAAALAEIAAGLGLGPQLRLGRGEDQSGGRSKTSILADATEAVIGAVYIDAGIETAEAFVVAQLGERIDAAALHPGETDYKTRLQELFDRTGSDAPVYSSTESGPDHHKRFRASVLVGAEIRGTGAGDSKKEAEQQAARAAWEARAEVADGADRAGSDARRGPVDRRGPDARREPVDRRGPDARSS